MSTILEKIASIEAEVTFYFENHNEFFAIYLYVISLTIIFFFQMARTQKNKATSGHLGLLKAKLAKLRRELITPKGGGGGGEQGFEVAKTGDARIGFVGAFLVIASIFYNPYNSCIIKLNVSLAVCIIICQFLTVSFYSYSI